MDMFPIDVRKTPTFDLLSELLYELFTPMTSLLNFVSDAQWYNTNETYMRGGVTAAYTSKSAISALLYLDVMKNPSQAYFDPSNITVLTNSLCMSTCTFFVKVIATTSSRIVEIGGIKGLPLDSSFSIGAPVFISETVPYCAMQNETGYFLSFPASAVLFRMLRLMTPLIHHCWVSSPAQSLQRDLIFGIFKLFQVGPMMMLSLTWYLGYLIAVTRKKPQNLVLGINQFGDLLLLVQQ